MLLFGIAVGLFGFISFTSFNQRVTQLEKDLNSKYEAHVSQSKVLSDDLQEMRANLHDEAATIYSEKAEKHFEKKEYDYFLFYQIYSYSRELPYYNYTLDHDTELAEKILTAFVSSMEYFITRLKELDEKPKISSKTFYRFTKGLKEIDDSSINDLLFQIQSLIEWETVA